jgi:hypothetical protein
VVWLRKWTIPPRRRSIRARQSTTSFSSSSASNLWSTSRPRAHPRRSSNRPRSCAGTDLTLSGDTLKTSVNKWSRDILLLFHLPWFANRAALEAMDQSLPPRPVLFLRLMLILKPSRFRQLLSNLWVTHPHTTAPYHPYNGRMISSGTSRRR